MVSHNITTANITTTNSTIPTNATDAFLTSPFTPFSVRIRCSLQTCGLNLSFYDYRPSIALNTLFIILFSITGFMHLCCLLFWRKKFFTICIAVGCFIEIIGYIARILGNENPFALGLYFIQFIGLTIAPAFFSASVYATLGEVISSMGPQFSRLRPEVYTKVFIGSDIASLILQASGGFATLGLLLNDKDAEAQKGIDVMLVGLGWQIVSLTALVFLAGEWTWRLLKWNRENGISGFSNKPGQGKFQVFLVFFCLSVFCIFGRCCYRAAELSGGLFGHLLRDEVVFTFLESMLIAISVFALNLGHPGMLAPPSIFSLDLDAGERDPEKPLPKLRVTPPSATQSDNDSQEDLILQSELPPRTRKQIPASRLLAQRKRLSRLSPNYFMSRRNPDNWPLGSRPRNEHRLSENSLTDIYTMYHGRETPPGQDIVKASSRQNPGGGRNGDPMKVIHIEDKGSMGSPGGITISLSYPGQRNNFI